MDEGSGLTRNDLAIAPTVSGIGETRERVKWRESVVVKPLVVGVQTITRDTGRLSRQRKTRRKQ